MSQPQAPTRSKTDTNAAPAEPKTAPAEAPPAEPKAPKAESGLVRLSYQVDRVTKAKFDAIATLAGESSDTRIERLMLADIATNSPKLPQSS